jgi:hypothetical protein
MSKLVRFDSPGGTIQAVATATASSIVERDGNGDANFKHPRADLAFVGPGIQLTIGNNGAVRTADWTLTEDGGVLHLVQTGAADVTPSLPSAASFPGMIVGFQKTDTGVGHVVIEGNAADTINGELQAFLTTQYEAIVLQSDGTNWRILCRYVPNSTTTKAAAFTAGPDATVYFVTMGSAFTITLQAAARWKGKTITFVKVDPAAFGAILDGNAAETINGSGTFNLSSTQWTATTILSDGSNWVVVNNKS